MTNLKNTLLILVLLTSYACEPTEGIQDLNHENEIKLEGFSLEFPDDLLNQKVPGADWAERKENLASLITEGIHDVFAQKFQGQRSRQSRRT